MWGTQGLVMGPCIVGIDCTQLEVNRCKNKEVNFQGSSANCTDGLTNSGDNQIIPRSNLEGVRSKLKIFQGSSAKSVGGDSVQDGQTDGGENQNIPTLLNAWG
ncbi:hypothetical protein DPMN_181205 [Dreissena polymorpha]|uniref:Uncharacterized protein n=1 Tax=Dreissena polymorpha TaxID=45954 RepID=A0A9D4DCE1_DREPO|nr:hypothetical protein DPMN_181205 [Dreissena polymorpha]